MGGVIGSACADSSTTDVICCNSTQAFNFHDDSTSGVPYLTTSTVTSARQIASYRYYNESGTGTNYTPYDCSSYWGPFASHAPSQVKSWKDANNRAQIATMLNQWQGYARDHDYVNENLGYTGHNWVRSWGKLDLNGTYDKNIPDGVYAD